MAMERAALGRGGSLGRLYDVRTDRLLSQSLLKAAAPATAVEVVETHHTNYELALSDTLQEKFSKLHISGDVSASFLSGLFEVSGSAKYLSTAKTSSRVQCASAICHILTKHETLVLGSDALKAALDLDALTDTDATHVITGIHWGGTSVVTVEGASSVSEGEINTSAGLSVPGTIAGVLISANASAELDAKTKEQASSFKFTINADISVGGRLPTDFEGVVQFLQTVPEALKSSNNGKGVPLRYDLVPIKDLAKKYQLEMQEDAIIAAVNQDCLSQFVELFQQIHEVRQQLNDYLKDVRNHKMCVPQEQVKKAMKQVSQAKRMEYGLKGEFSSKLVDVRQGVIDESELWALLEEYNSDQTGPESYRLILNEYRDKMAFADAMSARGVIYKPDNHNDLNELITTTDSDLYVLYFNEATRTGLDWRENHSVLLDLIKNRNSDYIVVVVDCDIHRASPRKLKRPFIEKIRDGNIIISDVVADMRELANKSLIRCSNESKINRSKTAAPPPGRRLVRIACPGKHCYTSGKFEWVCPTCKDVVCYGHRLASGKLDDYLYCGCGRYSPSDAEFKCKNPMHGVKYAKHHDPSELRALLGALEPSEEYNILILGETGVGKSTFINAFVNYMLFDSLDDAMLAEGPLHYVIPTSFSYQERDGEKWTDHFVKVGEESELEKQSRGGQSATQGCTTYVLSLRGKTIRLIDTPGIGDTRGIARDYENVKDILHTLESVSTLSTILFLLKPNTARLTQIFDFCMTELLSQLHQDASKNIVFGFTNARASNFALGDTKVPLETLLQTRGTGINLGYSNTFFFDAESFRFLALYKQKGKQMADKPSFDASWIKSTTDARRLIDETLKLPAHNVRETLQMNRTRLLITSMTKPMVQTSLAAMKTKADLQRQKDELKHLTADEKDLEKKLIIKYTVPVRVDLPVRKTVCTHENCSTIEANERTGDKMRVYPKACHHGCHVSGADEVIGFARLYWCRAFKRRGRECVSCGHDWKMHLHVSYEIRMEQKEMQDSRIVERIRSKEDAKKAIAESIQGLERFMKEIETEEQIVKNALAKFGVYLDKHAIVAYNDATINYLDYLIKDADRNGDQGLVLALEDQKLAYETQLKEVKAAIIAGKSSTPDEGSLEATISTLYDIKYYGPELMKVMPREPVVAPAARPPIFVSLGRVGGLVARRLEFGFIVNTFRTGRTMLGTLRPKIVS
ncbi:hypothetical protein GGS26DRAFT_197102 [Hypomontagnella submonticulosa]|nr:hypothetical protein GGS26DRAFT_197102 [Hypomontagnella submonticulosa]